MTGQTNISLTFDDALDSHLDHVMPLLDKFDVKGTFYVNISSECLGRRAKEWVQAASHGHELGNHSLLHQAISNKKWVREANSIENYTLDRMRMELEVANNVLRMLDGKTERSFAFPCSNRLLGHGGWTKRLLARAGFERTRVAGWIDRWRLDFGSSYKDYTGVVSELFFAARSGELPMKTMWPVHYDRYHVPSFVGDFRTPEQLLEAVQKAVQREAWLVFSFHGIGGGHGYYCELEAFEVFINELVSNERIVVKTFIDVAKDIWD